MACESCPPEIPDAAVVLARQTNWNRVVYRLDGMVHCVLKDSVSSERVLGRQRLMAEHSDLFEPFEYDVQTHTTSRRDLGDAQPTLEELSRIQAAIRERGIHIGDISAHNVRGGKVIDFEVSDHQRPSIRRALKRGVTVRKWKGGGVSITVHAATPEEIAAAEKEHGIKILPRKVVATNTTDCLEVFRQGRYAVKKLKPTVRAERIRERQALAEKYPDLLVPFEFEESRRTIRQEWLGEEHGSPEDVQRIKAELASRGEHRVCDIIPANVRCGRLIDFDIASELLQVDGKIVKQIVRM